MTTIIDYVVLNATFSSATINLVNLDSWVLFAWCYPDVQPQKRVRSWHRYSFSWYSWYDPMEDVHPYIEKYGRMQIYVLFPNMAPVLNRSKVKCKVDRVIMLKIPLFRYYY
jgi:hypothetical protein